MQTDILASLPMSMGGIVTGQNFFEVRRARIKGLYILPSPGVAGFVRLRDGGLAGSIYVTIATSANQTSPAYILLPGEGIVARNFIFAELSDVASLVVFYG